MDSKGRIKINLSKILGEKRITRRQLSIASGVRSNTISDLYNEKAKVISFENLIAICETLNCKIADLLEIVPK